MRVCARVCARARVYVCMCMCDVRVSLRMWCAYMSAPPFLQDKGNYTIYCFSRLNPSHV